MDFVQRFDMVDCGGGRHVRRVQPGRGLWVSENRMITSGTRAHSGEGCAAIAKQAAA